MLNGLYHRILNANRSDCALELVEACHRLNIEAYDIAAQDDVLSLLKTQADQIIITGQSRESYDDQDNILEAALHYGCEAILPGWGFLSEDFQFARRCRQLGIHFIGPTTRQIQLFGDKVQTLKLFEPAFHSAYVECSDKDFLKQISTIPAPYMLKPRFGGGGKNIRRIESLDELMVCLHQLKAANEAAHYFVEHAFDHKTCRHIEFQFIGDGAGHVECLGARDCTPQVNHQKWLERSICLENHPEFSQLAQKLTHILASIHYQSWGTVECLVNDTGRIHLLELNPRLQVEHGVTEIDRGIDLVKMAIHVSCAGKLPEFSMIQSSDNTLEFRLYARSCGILKTFGFESPVQTDGRTVFRMETAYSQGDEISGIYDGLLARFIIKHPENSLDVLKSILLKFQIEGVEHNLSELLNF